MKLAHNLLSFKWRHQILSVLAYLESEAREWRAGRSDAERNLVLGLGDERASAFQPGKVKF
jgi:hypothetical protein